MDQDNFVKKIRSLERLKLNAAALQSLHEKGKFIIFLKNELVGLHHSDGLLFQNFKEVENLRKYGDITTVFLDALDESSEERYIFAADLTLEAGVDFKTLEDDVNGKFVNMRHTLFFLDKPHAKYVTQARGLFNFGRSYKFCCFCGGSLNFKEGGLQKQCANCRFVHYPPLAPIGITLVENESHTEVLLVRQKKHPPGMYTCIAGFIETGESLEENVEREVAEEVGMNLVSVEYITSQHWALPESQLILGCIATVRGRTRSDESIDIDRKEIIDAKWVGADELREAVNRAKEVKNLKKIDAKVLLAPPVNAISHYLMAEWLKRYHSDEPRTSDH